VTCCSRARGAADGDRPAGGLLRGRPPAAVRDVEVPGGVRQLFARSLTTGARSSSTPPSSGSRSSGSASAAGRRRRRRVADLAALEPRRRVGDRAHRGREVRPRVPPRRPERRRPADHRRARLAGRRRVRPREPAQAARRAEAVVGRRRLLYATLYLPDFIFKWQSQDAVTERPTDRVGAAATRATARTPSATSRSSSSRTRRPDARRRVGSQAGDPDPERRQQALHRHARRVGVRRVPPARPDRRRDPPRPRHRAAAAAG
jgi:hypothetical protein